MIETAFDRGITHFDLANNYGPPPGSAEERFGAILKDRLAPYRDELVISTKAGYLMWDGPYGEWGSRKHLVASLDQSLKRLGLEYVDIFYHHRPDPNTPLEETAAALSHLVRQGKALYVGISNYKATDAKRAIELLTEAGTPCILNQVRYSLLDRSIEADGLLDAMNNRVGTVCFSPLAQGLLSSTYLGGSIPQESRATEDRFLKRKTITEEYVQLLNELDAVAQERGQSLSQMAISWLLRDERITSVLIGARSVSQLNENIDALKTNAPFTEEERAAIDGIVGRWR
jgi:L-glyceraldehyde 3-phosphate reductase